MAEQATTPEEKDFWRSRPALEAVHRFARARRVAPWALLGVVLARVSAATSPTLQLPPTRGTAASLNIFVGLCGESGTGKSATQDAGREFLQIRGGADFLETSPGSGEGLLAAYVSTPTPKRGEPAETIQNRVSVLLDVDEVGGLGALAARTNSTLLPFLKSAWTGRGLGTLNAEETRRRKIDPHRYRLAITCGIQPAHAGTILDDHGGGFPQRWLWMPTYDAGMIPHSQPTPEAAPWRWRSPTAEPILDDPQNPLWPAEETLILPAEAEAEILEAAELHNRPLGAPAPADGLDGHALLNRAKVAALLALLDGRNRTVTPEDWRLAGTIMAVSDATRAEVIAVRERLERLENHKRARARGLADDVSNATRDQAATRRMSDRILTVLGEVGENGLARSELRRKTAYRDRTYLDAALELLLEAGKVESKDIDYQGQTGTMLRVVPHGNH